jgi:predicted DNA-binding transcriptional regulator AlpA
MEEVNSKIFLNTDEIAAKLGRRKSWIYRQCMRRGPDSIPRLKIGKYNAYIEADVVSWIRRQSEAALQ